MNIVTKERSQLTKREELTGEERLPINGYEYITPSQIAKLFGGSEEEITELQNQVTNNKEAIDKLNGDDTTAGSVSHKITKAIEKLDVIDNTSEEVNGVSVTVLETDGKVRKPVINIKPGDVAANDTKLVTGAAVKQAIDTGLANKVIYGDTILSTNPFIQKSSLYISKIDNSWYCLNKRHTVELTMYDADGNVDTTTNLNPNAFFDGNYETSQPIPKDNKLKIHITFNGYESTTYNGTKVYPGYPYGEIILSFYYTGGPKSVTGRVYCNYESHGIGWHDLTFTAGPKNPSHSLAFPGYNQYYATQNKYAISELEITIEGHDPASFMNYKTLLTQIELKSKRPSPTITPFVSKYGKEKLYYDLEAPSFTAKKFNGPATGVVDYNDENRIIKIGLGGSGLTSSNIKYVACYTEGNKIKDANLAAVKEWLGVKDIDSTLSDTSTNPVQNKVIKVSLDNLNDNIENVASTANAANNTATTANANAKSALSKITALENKETTIAGQKVKIGGEVTPVQLTKGLKLPTRNVLSLLMSDASSCLSSFNTYLAENNVTISDYFCAPTMIYRDETDLEPYCGMMYNSPESNCLTGIFDTGTDTGDFTDICKIQFYPNNCNFNIGDSGISQVPSITIDVTTRPTTSSPVTVTLTDYQYNQMIDMGIKKYVSFRKVATVNNVGNIVELNFTNKVISIVDSSENYVYQHICYYSGGMHIFEFNLNSGTKVLTAKMIM